MAPIFITAPVIMSHASGGAPMPPWAVLTIVSLLSLLYLELLFIVADVAFGREWRSVSSSRVERAVGYLCFAAVASPLIVGPVAYWWLR